MVLLMEIDNELNVYIEEGKVWLFALWAVIHLLHMKCPNASYIKAIDLCKDSQKAETVSNKISNNINKNYTEIISML